MCKFLEGMANLTDLYRSRYVPQVRYTRLKQIRLGLTLDPTPAQQSPSYIAHDFNASYRKTSPVSTATAPALMVSSVEPYDLEAQVITGAKRQDASASHLRLHQPWCDGCSEPHVLLILLLPL